MSESSSIRLIIAEKPSVARDIARVFNVRKKQTGYYESERVWVTWCVGHMVELGQPDDHNPDWGKWRRQTLPMLPEKFKLKPIKSSYDQYQVVKKLIHDARVQYVVNACDAGREGELIFRYVYELAKGKKPIKRAWLASMTDEAIKSAFKQLQDGQRYEALADAARARSEADWLVGLNGTRAMTLQCRAAGGQETMHIGRVQTPTLAMLVHREQEIEAFVPEDFWQIYATFDASPQAPGLPTTYEGIWTKNKQDRVLSPLQAEEILQRVEGEPGELVEVTHKTVRERPPLLFDLTSLQRLANQRYGYSAQDTLDSAQSLYEKHKLLTYPRTDSNYLTDDMRAGLGNIVAALEVEPYAAFSQHLQGLGKLPTSKRIINNDEVGDHHAIIPTDKRPDLNNLPERERRIYDLVATRFLAAFYPDAIFATTQLTTQVHEHQFITRGKQRVEAGWQEVEPPFSERVQAAKAAKSKGKGKGKDDDSAKEPMLPTVTKGQTLPNIDGRIHQGQTSPPKRYSESTLLGAMERAGNTLDDAELRRAMKESGLGTPATRASIIEKLIKSNYIVRERKNLVPTAKGRALIEAVSFEPLKSAQLTGQWEAKLTAIASGKLERSSFMHEIHTLTRELTDTFLSQSVELSEELQAQEAEILGQCPLCRAPVTEGHKAYSCATGRDCEFVIFKTIAGKKISAGLVKLLLSGKTSQRLKGFKSKKTKNSFEASLRLNAQGKVDLVFDHEEPSEQAPVTTRPQEQAPAAPAKRAAASKQAKAPAQPPQPQQPAAEAAIPTLVEQLDCPRCQRGKLVAGKRGWGCERWREGCKFVLWFEHEGITLDNERALELIACGHVEAGDAQTLHLNPFKDPPLSLEHHA